MKEVSGKLKDICVSENFDRTKLIRIEVDNPEHSEQHLYVNIDFALKEMAEIEVYAYEETVWTYAVYAKPLVVEESENEMA